MLYGSNTRRAGLVCGLVCLVCVGCDRPNDETAAKPKPASATATPSTEPPEAPVRVTFDDTAMGTTVKFVAFTNEHLDAGGVQHAMKDALREMRRLAALMTSWTDDSDVGRVNANTGKPVEVDKTTFEVFEKSLWAGKISEGAFDVSFDVMSDLWRFGDAAEKDPKLPSKALVDEKRRHIDYRKITLKDDDTTVRIEKGMRVGLGGIAKGYIVDRAADVLKKAGVAAFLAQAGGDLYGAGRKPNGDYWVSGIQDPRGPLGQYFATIQLENHAFSTAGDYARAFVLDGKRYHHIIDPRTGYPATASRSVTVWAPDALTADAVDDAIFILGVEKGLALVESLPGVGAVIVDDENRVHVSHRLEGKVQILRQPTGGI